MDFVGEAIATATQIGVSAAKTAGLAAVRFVEQGTETLGKIVTPIAEDPLIKNASKVPGVNLLLTALGQVDVEKAQNEIDMLRLEYPLETPEQLAHRIMINSALKAGALGLVTNFAPPLALTTFGVELAAVTALQAEMIYRIAAAYGLSLQDPARRGEVLAIFGLSIGSSGVLKAELGMVEVVPLVGAAIGASSNAILLYSLGFVASRFYEARRNFPAEADITDDTNS